MPLNTTVCPLFLNLGWTDSSHRDTGYTASKPEILTVTSM